MANTPAKRLHRCIEERVTDTTAFSDTCARLRARTRCFFASTTTNDAIHWDYPLRFVALNQCRSYSQRRTFSCSQYAALLAANSPHSYSNTKSDGRLLNHKQAKHIISPMGNLTTSLDTAPM